MIIDRSKVKLIMLDKGIAPSDLAFKMKLSASRISNLLNKDVSKSQIKTIYSLAKVLNVAPAEILKGEL